MAEGSDYLSRESQMTQCNKRIESRRSDAYKLPLGWFGGCLLLACLCLGFKSLGNQSPSGAPSAPAKAQSRLTEPNRRGSRGRVGGGRESGAEGRRGGESRCRRASAGGRLAKVSLQMAKQDGDLLRMEFLRPAAWLESHYVQAGGKVSHDPGRNARRRLGRRAGGRALPADPATTLAAAPPSDGNLRPCVGGSIGPGGRGSGGGPSARQPRTASGARTSRISCRRASYVRANGSAWRTGGCGRWFRSRPAVKGCRFTTSRWTASTSSSSPA